MAAVLPDVLTPNLKVVFCGTAAGDKSAQRGAYYAGPGNQFWPVLHRIGLTSRQLNPDEFRQLADYGIGLTDLAQKTSRMDKKLRPEDFDVAGFRQRIEHYAPKIVAFNGKKAAKVYFRRKKIDYGQQEEKIGETLIFVLPSTSGAARGFWNEVEWQHLARVAETLS